jgi:hypothetical protein
MLSASATAQVRESTKMVQTDSGSAKLTLSVCRWWILRSIAPWPLQGIVHSTKNQTVRNREFVDE